jgi:DNA-binding transcriptional ArsR family regulator
VLGEPRRREILRLVWSKPRAAGEIAARMPVTFGAVSQHLRVLRDAGYVTVERKGKQRIYRAKADALGPFRPALEAMWASGLARLSRLAEEEERRGTT